MHPEVKEVRILNTMQSVLHILKQDKFIENNPQPPIDWSDYEGLRTGMAMMSQMQAAQIGPANPDVLTEEYKDIKMSDGTTSTLKIHKPVHPPSKGSPLIVFAFGGGVGSSVSPILEALH